MAAWAGLLVGIIRRRRLALYLAALAALAAAAYRWTPQGVLWNARLLPFYYLAMLLLAGVGVATLLTTLITGGSLRDLPKGSPDPPPGGRERAGSPSPLAWADSVRFRVLVAAVVPLGAVAVAIDDLVAGSATLRALIEVLPGRRAFHGAGAGRGGGSPGSDRAHRGGGGDARGAAAGAARPGVPPQGQRPGGAGDTGGDPRRHPSCRIHSARSCRA